MVISGQGILLASLPKYVFGLERYLAPRDPNRVTVIIFLYRLNGCLWNPSGLPGHIIVFDLSETLPRTPHEQNGFIRLFYWKSHHILAFDWVNHLETGVHDFITKNLCLWSGSASGKSVHIILFL